MSLTDDEDKRNPVWRHPTSLRTMKPALQPPNDQRGFIRRVPRQARAIELTIAPEWIPPLDQPFKF